MLPPLAPASGYIACIGTDAWGRLRGLAWYAAQRPDGVVFFFIPRELNGAHEAGETIRRVAAKRWPQLRVIIPGDSSTNSAESFRRRLSDWKIFRAEIREWIIDVTAATVPVREAIQTAAAADSSITLIAHEGDDAWWHYRHDPASSVLHAARIGVFPAAGLDQGPLTDLLEPFTQGVAEVRWRDSRAPQALAPDAIARMVAAGVASNWNWRAMVESATGVRCAQSDYDLRDFVATVLQAMGVANARINVRLAWTALKEDPLTLDVLACHKGRLFLFDCRAADDLDSGLSPQAADLMTNICVRLGVTGIALRPNRWATAAERTLAALTPAAHLFDATACRQLFSRLGALLDITVPPALIEAERTSLRFGGRKLPVLSAASDAQRVGAALRVDERIYDVWRGARADDAATDWPWRAIRVTPDRWFLQGRVMQGGSADHLSRRLDERLRSDHIRAEIIFFELSGNRRFWHALLLIPGDPHHFPRWLQRWEKVPLIV